MAPNLKKYLDISQYLQDWYEYKKSVDENFSFRTWAEELGITNKSYLRFVVLGRRKVTPTVLEALKRSLSLNQDDLKYLDTLVEYSQAKTAAQKKIFGQSLIAFLKSESDAAEIEAHYDLLSNPLLTKLLTLLSFDDIRKDTATLSQLLMKEPSEIIEGLKILLKIEAIEQDGDVYISTNKSFKISDKFNTIGLRNYYYNLFEEAKSAIQLPAEQRKFRSLLVPMSEAELAVYIEKMDRFAKEQIAQHDVHELKERKIYQIHFNIFPVTEEPDEDILVKC